MTKPPLILPSDPSFYELPPPPGSTPEPSVEDLLSEIGQEPEDDREDGEDAVEAVPVVAGSCDSHVRFPPASEAADTSGAPAPDPVAGYLRQRAGLGLDRTVVVQSSGHGFDHAALLGALDRLGPERVRGVAAVGPSTSESEIRDLDASGCVAARFQMRDPWRRIGWVETDRLAARVHDLVDWDVDLEMDGRFLMEVEDRLRSWPGRVVLDHIGCFLGPVSDRDPGLRALLRLIDADKVWVKLSGPEESDPQSPRYPHAERIARLLIRFAPERLVWGSNWPRPATKGPDAPDDVGLLDLLGEWCEDAGLRDRILIANAAALWRFPTVDAATASSGSAAGPDSGDR